jgi:ABC-type nickel/cobalt efflux system permease component RcnA
MTFEQFSNGLLEWVIRIAGALWLIGAFMLFRQIRAEMALDSMAEKLERTARELGADAPAAIDAADAWRDRDDRARRGWIAAQAVVLAATSLAMILLHPFASGMIALLVLGQGAYFLWREHIARRAPTPEAAIHARPSQSTVNAGWVSFAVAVLVWLAAFRGLLH